MEKAVLRHTDLNVKNRNLLTLNGVVNVESFDENYLSLSLAEGSVCVEGENLKIESLRRDNGEIEISGRITGVYYTDNKKLKTRFSKFFG
ncbi:MAG: YabP/YqfC family sporulation protein [Clostridia bacterium]|nr:YabP/YqfC family sporulation protein [Clostridia bacterium]